MAASQEAKHRLAIVAALLALVVVGSVIFQTVTRTGESEDAEPWLSRRVLVREERGRERRPLHPNAASTSAFQRSFDLCVPTGRIQ